MEQTKRRHIICTDIRYVLVFLITSTLTFGVQIHNIQSTPIRITWWRPRFFLRTSKVPLPIPYPTVCSLLSPHPLSTTPTHYLFFTPNSQRLCIPIPILYCTFLTPTPPYTFLLTTPYSPLPIRQSVLLGLSAYSCTSTFLLFLAPHFVHTTPSLLPTFHSTHQSLLKNSTSQGRHHGGWRP